LSYTLEIDMQDRGAPRVHLDVAQQHLLLLARQIQRQDRGVKRLVLEVQGQFLVVDLDGLRRPAASVEDARHALLVTQAAARTFALRGAQCCIHFDCHVWRGGGGGGGGGGRL